MKHSMSMDLIGGSLSSIRRRHVSIGIMMLVDTVVQINETCDTLYTQVETIPSPQHCLLRLWELILDCHETISITLIDEIFYTIHTIFSDDDC